MSDSLIFVQPQTYADPAKWHAAAARLRRDNPLPLVEIEGVDPFYAVTRHDHIVEIERQHEKFWNTGDSVLGPREMRERIKASGGDLKTLIHMDGDEHRDYRKLTNDWFKPANLRQELEGSVDRLAKEFVDRMAKLGGDCDFAADVALYYPLRVIMSVLGVPEEDEPRMLRAHAANLRRGGSRFRRCGSGQARCSPR